MRALPTLFWRTGTTAESVGIQLVGPQLSPCGCENSEAYSSSSVNASDSLGLVVVELDTHRPRGGEPHTRTHRQRAPRQRHFFVRAPAHRRAVHTDPERFERADGRMRT
jgi:hypothetical protein